MAIQRTRVGLWGIIAILFALFIYAFWIEPTSLVIRHVRLPIAGLATPVKAVLIGDPQPMKPFWPSERIRWAMDQAAAQKPDIVFFVGDYAYEPQLLGKFGLISWLFVQPADTIAAMDRIKAPMGSYAVMGNHDWWWNGPEVIRLFGKTQIHLLQDKALLAQAGKKSLWVAGLDDMNEAHDYSLPATLAQTDQRAPIIMLSHSPEAFAEKPLTKVALHLAGHTHGGQVYLPLIGRPVVPIQHKKYAYGLINESGRQLFVTAGIGTAIIPVRFLTPPEIIVLELVPQGT
jgi:predicted MPP superfamily phosphohydrolase